MKRVSIVVPVFHNAASLPELMRRFCQVAARNEEEFEFIFVDDGSQDHSFRVLETLAQRDPRVRAIRLTRNFGSNAASAAGIAHARGDCIVAISADLQDPPELIDSMLERWREGYRVVLAARQEREDPWLTSVTSNLFWRLFRRFGVPTMPEQGCDYCLLDRVVLETLKDTYEPRSGLGIVLWTGFEPAVVHYRRRRREAHYGKSRWTFSKKLTYLIDSFVSFSHAPIRAASITGILLAFVGMMYAFLLTAQKLFLGLDAFQGWASLMVVVLVVSGVQLAMTGILGEYMVRTLESARRRPPYIVDRIVGHRADGSSAVAAERQDERPESTEPASTTQARAPSSTESACD